MCVELGVIFSGLFIGQTVYMAMPFSTALNAKVIALAMTTHAKVGLIAAYLDMKFKSVFDGMRQTPNLKTV